MKTIQHFNPFRQYSRKNSMYSCCRNAFIVTVLLFCIASAVNYLVLVNTIVERALMGSTHERALKSSTEMKPNDAQGDVIHACARFSTRYEKHHLIPWLLHNKGIGVSHFHVYVDPVSSNLEDHFEKVVYEVAESLPYTTIYDTKALNIYEEHTALHHCLYKSHMGFDKVDWIIDFDIDELFVLGSMEPSQPEDCKNTGYYEEGQLAKWAAHVPQSTLAVIFPHNIILKMAIRHNWTFIPSEKRTLKALKF